LFEVDSQDGDSGEVRYLIQDAGWERRPAPMSRPCSLDLRERVVAAVASGMSREAAADHYQVSY